MAASDLIRSLAGRLIVSCQAPEGSPFRSPDSMARFARAAAAGGAAGIRANSPQDVRSIRRAVTLPIVGLQKHLQADGRNLITISFDDAADLVGAGADIVAIDCTIRGQKTGALERLRRIRDELKVPVLADIATIDEAVAAAEAGADLVASTMRGYTEETASVQAFEPGFITALASRLNVPIIAEGRIGSCDEAAEAVRAGAYAVIVGTAITHPEAITAKFARALEDLSAEKNRIGDCILGIDLGGTNTKAGVVSPEGDISHEFVVPTPQGVRSERLLSHLEAVVSRGLESAQTSGIEIRKLGVATAGWVDPRTGRVVWATDNLPGWTGTPVADALRAATRLDVVVENDANALAVAERRYGAGRTVDDFVCLTLGTGVGGGFYSGGRLVRGAHSLANAVGHITIQRDGRYCSCGRRGCLEAYANAAALTRYAGPSFLSAEDVIRAARDGHLEAVDALRTYASHLATGLTSIVHLLDPELVVIAGGLAQENDLLFSYLDGELEGTLIAAQKRRLQICPSSFSYHAGVLGAAATALERC